ncbi:hypothetical protein J1605_000001 [Eschrichtius robustus]|uniref:AGC-kinase C-terminal domain-containing protein n=1 Tax=Eschrichtius robustus TaxID=9764 RepID=A0AB34I8B6_ESCRO|nr:hypothetical protein J1605_000001 [Eschrichtius robustus]
MNVELPDIFSPELQSLLEGLLQRDVSKRLGCHGRGAQELKTHDFFRGIDWQQVYLQKYPPPLIPPRGEVNAADAFDIGSFDEEDTKGIKAAVQSDPEFLQWKKELTETFTEAQRLVRRAPKFLNQSRLAIVELSKPPLCHRNSNGL